jgi:hypothetical protein
MLWETRVVTNTKHFAWLRDRAVVMCRLAVPVLRRLLCGRCPSQSGPCSGLQLLALALDSLTIC